MRFQLRLVLVCALALSVVDVSGDEKLTGTVIGTRECVDYSNCAMWALPMPVVTKFDKKQHVLDAPAKAKKWTLINNYGDKTLMRNLLAFELSKRLGYTYRPNAIADVTIDMAQPYLVFTLEGLPCGTTLEGLRPGIYVVRQGLLSRKVIVR